MDYKTLHPGQLIYFSLPIISWFLLAIPNFDLILGRWALDMDQQILFDHLKRIFHYDSKEQLLSLIYKGGYPHYGTTFFNINAIVCLLPKIFFGDSGVIFAARMSGAFFMILSLVFFTITFLKNWMLRSFCFLVLINVPGVSYFMCNPKPDPIQLFFLSLFFYFFKKNAFSLSKYYWIFLGISFGTKISAFLFFIFLPIFSFLYVFTKKSFYTALTQVPNTIFFIFLGLAISSPFLFPNVFLSYMIFNVVKYVFLKNMKGNPYVDILSTLVLITLNIAITAILYNYFAFTTNASSWFINTFLSTQHPADHQSINFFSWLKYFFTIWLGDSILLNASLLISSILIIFKKSNLYFKDFKSNKNIFAAFAILFIGIITITTLFINVKRLWLWYLTPWIICIIIGVFSFFEIFYEKNSLNRMKKNHFLLKSFIPLAFIFSIAGTMQNWIFNNYIFYKDYSQRTKSEIFQNEKISYLTILDFLEETSKKKGYPITVAYDSFLPIPDKNGRFFTHRFFEPFEKWDVKYDAIVLSERIKKRVQQNPDPKTYEYDQLVNEKIGYEKHVLTNGKSCDYGNCYKKHKTLKNGGEILISID